jgi:hypothetical protein
MNIRGLSIAVFVVAMGWGAAFPDPAAARSHSRYYLSSDGSWVRRPHGDWHVQGIPPGATTRCVDGTYSHSRHPNAPGTCSYHGGVYNYIGSAEGAREAVAFSAEPSALPLQPVPTDNICGPGYRMAPGGCEAASR